MKRVLLSLLSLLVFAAPAAAAPVLKFDDPIVTGGIVAHAGVLGLPITGTGIPFQSITGLDTPLNSGVTLACIGCLLNFQTGGVTQEGPTAWIGGAGGFLALVGAVPGLGLGAGTLLASGDFLGGPLAPTVNATGTSGTFTGFGFDTKHSTLASFFGLGPDFVFLSTEIALTTTRIGAGGGFALPGQFSATPNNSDFNNASREVPGPATLLLVGAGLLTAVYVPWRRRA